MLPGSWIHVIYWQAFHVYLIMGLILNTGWSKKMAQCL